MLIFTEVNVVIFEFKTFLNDPLPEHDPAVLVIIGSHGGKGTK